MPTIFARRVLTPRGWLGPARIDIDDSGLIESVVEDIEAARLGPDEAFATVVAGFVDLQVNGIDDIDVFHASDQDWERISGLLLDQGVTSWCPTLVTNHLDRLDEPLRRIASARDASLASNNTAAIIGAHLEGPFLGGAPGAHRRDLLVPIDLEWLRGLPEVVRIVTLAPELTGSAAAISMLAARGVVVSLGHSTPSVDDVSVAVAAGATMVTHLFNGMSGVHHRDPGLASVALVDDRLSVGLIADLIHVHPTALQLAFRSKRMDGIVLVTDSVGWRRGSVGEVRMAIRNGAPRLADGTLAGTSLTMDQAIRNLVDDCGVPLDRAIRAASANPARVVGCTDRGEITIGRRADLVSLDDRLRVSAVWLAGHRVR